MEINQELLYLSVYMYIWTVQDDEMEVLAEMDAYVIVYGVDDRSSFAFAHTMLTELLEKRNLKTAVLLVANKSDLVRTREVEAERK